MEVQITQIKNESAAAIIDLVLPIQQIEFKVAITLSDQPDLLDIDNVYYKNGGAFWGATSEGKLLGTIAMIKFSNNAVALRKMFVKKEFRGKELGLAQRLLENLIIHCKNNGIDHLYLGTVPVLQAALRFYERNGFQKMEKVDLPTQFPLMGGDSVFYQLSLK
ncbi:GNAT family N-acetyltransferase [Pedobacter gandavensis]|uniref:GNAT family N-acetyltransferase n=1 Tax=Pedobacter gandavensis TaxID=2679963 RepID=A0ABR6EUY1_9SPHI|nr:GNAT family N-acetyltransferase [Pedobacter gandavensis]MBB2149050.1 GNAT family N-acetyltransferase [Pedobacter gandavensis]